MSSFLELDLTALIESPIGMMHVKKAAFELGITEKLLSEYCNAGIFPSVPRENAQCPLFINCRDLNRMLDAGLLTISSPRKKNKEAA